MIFYFFIRFLLIFLLLKIEEKKHVALKNIYLSIYFYIYIYTFSLYLFFFYFLKLTCYPT